MGIQIKRLPSLFIVLITAMLCIGSYLLGLKQGAASSSGGTADQSIVSEFEPASTIEGGVSSTVAEGPGSRGMRSDAPGQADGITADIESEQKQRLMRNISENLAMPGMNQIIREQQRVLMADKYRDLIQTLGLNDREQEYLLDLLTARQMLQVDMGMKLMTGMLSEAERTEMMEQVGSGMNELEKEIDWFLNNGTDSDYFRYYDRTEGERATVTSVANALDQAGHPFNDGVEKELVAILYEELTRYPFSVNLEEDGRPVFENFTEDNINTFLQELDRMRDPVFQQAASVLDPEQLEVFEQYYAQYVAFFAQRLQMARQFFNPAQ